MNESKLLKVFLQVTGHSKIIFFCRVSPFSIRLPTKGQSHFKGECRTALLYVPAALLMSMKIPTGTMYIQYLEKKDLFSVVSPVILRAFSSSTF